MASLESGPLFRMSVIERFHCSSTSSNEEVRSYIRSLSFTGENDKNGSSLPQHLQGDFPTLRDNQQQEGGRRERPVDGPPTGWGGAAPDSKQQARRGPPHQGHYPG